MTKHIIQKNILKAMGILFLMILLECLSLLGVCCIPKTALYDNLYDSALLLNEREVFFYANPGDAASYIDRYADSILLNIAYSIDEESPFTSMLEASYYHDAKENENVNLLTALTYDTSPNQDYARYWHGSLVFLRPLLLILNLRQIYVLLGILLCLLLLTVILLIYKRIGLVFSIGFGISALCVSPWYIPLSLEYCPTILLALAGCIVLLLLYKPSASLDLSTGNGILQDFFHTGGFFLCMGSLTSFTDFLTTETLTFLLPFCLILLLEHKQKAMTFKAIILRLIHMLIYWGIGYCFTWMAKWFLTAAFCDGSIFADVFSQGALRTTGNIDTYKATLYPLALLRNLSFLLPFNFMEKQITLWITISIALLLVFIFLFRREKKELSFFAGILCVGALPLLRYMLLATHAFQHCFFTYRALWGTLFCLYIALVFGIQWKEVFPWRHQTKKRRK